MVKFEKKNNCAVSLGTEGVVSSIVYYPETDQLVMSIGEQEYTPFIQN
jgi:hypothetical protein